jgi:hypothetical protein
MSPRLVLIPRETTPTDRRQAAVDPVTERSVEKSETSELEMEAKRELDQMWWWAMGV